MESYGRQGLPSVFSSVLEKPRAEAAPSRLASIGRYVLEPEILDILAETPPGAGGEIQLADAINARAVQGHVNAVPLLGVRYDCGSKFGYLEAIVDFALDHADYGPAFGALIAQRGYAVERASRFSFRMSSKTNLAMKKAERRGSM